MTRERLGEITVPSGTLTLLDPGHIGMYEEKEIPEVPSLSIAGIPRDRPLPVYGVRVGEGRFASCWEYVAVELTQRVVAESVEVGDAIVDFARLLLIDEGAAERWVHAECLDGLADFVFWGRDAPAMATALAAMALDDGTFGWRDLPAAEAMGYAIEAEALKEQRGFTLATDYRPHSHHYQALEGMRRSATASSTIEVAEARVCLFATSWGDGLFPVFLDLAEDGTPVQLRIQLHTDASEDALSLVNG